MFRMVRWHTFVNVEVIQERLAGSGDVMDDLVRFLRGRGQGRFHVHCSE